MYFTDRGIEELTERRGEDQVSMAWLAERLRVAGLETGEKVWRLPLTPAYDKLIDSKFADMKNTGGRHAGSITAAQFLQRFTNETPWAHLDIAGPAFEPDAAHGCTPLGGTGCGVRTLVALAQAEVEASVAAQIVA